MYEESGERGEGIWTVNFAYDKTHELQPLTDLFW